MSGDVEQNDSGGGEPRSSDEVLLDELMEEFTAAVRRGDNPSVDEYATRYPALAERIRALFPALCVLEEAPERDSATIPPGDFAGPAETAQARTIGGYRLLREVGRGGMGVVYEAEHEALGRRVALKILPSFAGLDARRRDRFRREARAAGALQHPNIVPVHDVGEEDDTLYYVMSLIEGRGLDEVIHEIRRERDRGSEAFDGLGTTILAYLAGADRAEGGPSSGKMSPTPTRPRPSSRSGGGDSQAASGSLSAAQAATGSSSSSRHHFRGIASLGVQVARALQHAHDGGVLHRDIKPSNLLLDAKGTVWVTDFGLAKLEGGEDLTGSNDLLGTLRYLAPERLQGWSDPRSDVYSLGLTLYEVATLEPAFDSTDQSALLKRIAAHEPRRPRALEGRLPRDLETVILKAIAKEPASRYQTAAELADDLERFLRDEPVRARSTTILERSVKWSRRHPAAAGLIAVIALAVLTVLGGSLWYNARLSVASERAERNYRRAISAGNRWMTQVADEDLLVVPQLTPIRERLLEEAFELNLEFLAETPNDPVVRYETAKSAARVGRTLQRAGRRATAEERYRLAERMLEELTREDPGRREYAEALTSVRSALELLQTIGLPAEGLIVDRFLAREGGKGIVDVTAADLDRDQRIDLIAAERDGHVVVLRAVDRRRFEASQSVSACRDLLDIESVDIDLNGTPDIVGYGRVSQTVAVIRSGPDGALGTPSLHKVGFEPYAMVVANLDDDAYPEVAVLGHYLRVLGRNADGELDLREPVDVLPLGNSLAAADFDDDGDIDLATGCAPDMQGKIEFLYNDGSGSFTERVELRAGCLPFGLLAADLDGDGRVDLAATDYLAKPPTITVVLNRGARTFEVRDKFAATPPKQAVAAADLDADGDADLVTTDEDNGVVSLYLNDGSGCFPVVRKFAAGGGAFAGLASDLDGDDDIDLAVANGIAHGVVVLYHVREFLARPPPEPEPALGDE